MPKILETWEQILIAVFAQGKAKDWDVLALSPKLVANLTSKGLFGLILVSLWWWNWQLLISVGAAVTLMWFSLKVTPKQFARFWQKVLVFFRKGHNHRLFWGGLSSSLGGIFTYMSLAIWSDSPNHWLAVGSIAQGLMTMLIVLILGWQLLQQNQETKVNEFSLLVRDLVDGEALKRLIAIRQLTNLGIRGELSEQQILELQEYFGLMLDQPQESIVQNALLDGLEVVNQNNLPVAAKTTLLSPLELKQSLRELS